MSVERNSRGLVKILFDELDALKSGDSTPQAARSKAAVVNTIVTVKRLEMDHARFVAGARMDNDKLAALEMQ